MHTNNTVCPFQFLNHVVITAFPLSLLCLGWRQDSIEVSASKFFRKKLLLIWFDPIKGEGEAREAYFKEYPSVANKQYLQGTDAYISNHR